MVLHVSAWCGLAVKVGFDLSGTFCRVLAVEVGSVASRLVSSSRGSHVWVCLVGSVLVWVNLGMAVMVRHVQLRSVLLRCGMLGQSWYVELRLGEFRQVIARSGSHGNHSQKKGE